MASAHLELRNVSFSFAGEELVSDVNIQVESGERLVLIGPSGQGKSLLLKIMGGIIRPSRGEVFIHGKNLHQMTSTERLQALRRMGMLFQKNALFDSMTVAENVAFPLREVKALSESEISDRVNQFLEAVGIHHAAQLYPDEISGGMQKRLGIARALALEPELIFYDDPTAGLDPITSRRIIDLIVDLQRKRGSTVVAITNEMSRAFQLADRIAMVVDRSVLVTGSVAETKTHLDPRVHQFVRGDITGPLTTGAE